MQKIIATITRNKNLVLAILLLLIMSMSTMLMIWDADVSSQKISLAHFGVHHEEKSPEEFHNWEEVVANIQPGQTYFVLDQDARITHFDQDFINTMGYSSETIQDKEFFPFVHQNDLPELMVSLIKVLQTGESVANVGPYRIHTTNLDSEEYRTFIGTILPINSEDDTTNELVVIHKDITEDVSTGQQDSESNHPKIRNQKNTAETRKIVQD